MFNKKMFMVMLSCIMVFGILVSPYGISFGNTSQVIDMFVLTEKSIDAETALKTIRESRGEEISRIGDINLHTDTEWDTTKKGNYNSFAFPIESANENIKKDIQQLIQSGKLVYLYGENIDLETAEKIYDIPITPDEEALQSKNLGANKLSEKYNMIGLVIANGEKSLSKGTITVENPDGTPKTVIQTFMYVDQILENLVRQHLAPNSWFMYNVANATGTRIDSDMSNLSTLYIGTTKIATLNGDYHLWQEKEECSDTYDYFSMESSLELINYNGANNEFLHIRHTLPYKDYGDEVEKWDPSSDTSGSSWTVSLPWGISWSFDTAASVAVDQEGSTTTDYAEWLVSKRWYQSSLVSPALFVPGTTWLSTGTLAGIDINTTGYVYYNGETKEIYQTEEYRYSYSTKNKASNCQ